MSFFLSKIFLINTALAGGFGESITISNPLGEGTTITTLISHISDFIVLVSIPILSLVILYAAFQIMTAGGKEEQFKKGSKTLLYGVIGFAIILAAEGLIKLLEAILIGTATN